MLSAPPSPRSHEPPPAITSTPPPDILQPAEEAPRIRSTLDSSTLCRTLQIGTRASALALAQVEIFTSILSTLHPTLPTKTVPISVAGDRDKITDLHTLAQTGKSLWTEELEILLLKGEIDCIVHSLKDVPTKVVAGCEVKIVGERGERRDCVVFPKRSTMEDHDSNSAPAATSAEVKATSNDESSIEKRRLSSSVPPPSPQRLADLPAGSVVGTSSIRRSAMIRRHYPTLRILDVRGNVGTRLRKLDDPANGFDCLILAAAGIQRVGLGERVGEWLDPGQEAGSGADEKGTAMLHAVGQGAIGLEVREGDEWVNGLLEGREGKTGAVVNRVSWECQAERSLLRTLEGGCSVPVGVSCSWEEVEVENITSANAIPSSDEPTNNSTTSESHTITDSIPTLSSSPQPPDTSLSSTSSSAPLVAPLPTSASHLQMHPGTLHIHASVTSVDGIECVSASHKSWVGNDKEADDAGWEVARVLVERGAGKILEKINLNRGMVERGDNA